jgi:hypothetical protein
MGGGLLHGGGDTDSILLARRAPRGQRVARALPRRPDPHPRLRRRRMGPPAPPNRPRRGGAIGAGSPHGARRAMASAAHRALRPTGRGVAADGIEGARIAGDCGERSGGLPSPTFGVAPRRRGGVAAWRCGGVAVWRRGGVAAVGSTRMGMGMGIADMNCARLQRPAASPGGQRRAPGAQCPRLPAAHAKGASGASIAIVRPASGPTDRRRARFG